LKRVACNSCEGSYNGPKLTKERDIIFFQEFRDFTMQISDALKKFAVPLRTLKPLIEAGILSSDRDLAFVDLVTLRFISECKKKNISLKEILSTLPKEEEKKSEWIAKLRFGGSGDKILLYKEKEGLLQKATGQYFINFTGKESVHSLEQQDARDRIPELSGLSSSAVRKVLKDFIKKNPGHVGALIELGNQFFTEDKLDDALRSYEEALSSDPNCVEAVYNLANVYYKKRKYSVALRLLHESLEMDPDFSESYYNLGIIYFGLKYFDRALVYLSAYEERDADSPWAEQARQIIEDILYMQSQRGLFTEESMDHEDLFE